MSVKAREQATHNNVETFSYVPSLDGLRAVAVLFVMAAHRNLIILGGLGVDIFFVLSGFLSYYVIEKPCLALKERISGSKGAVRG